MFRMTLLAILASSACQSHAAETPRSSRFSFSPAVQAILQSPTPEGELARNWLRYAEALTGDSGVRLEDVVPADVRCLELEAAGFPPGLQGLRLFRQQINAALPDERGYVAEMRFPGPGIIETELHGSGTHRGEFFGRKPTGLRVSFQIRTLNRFENGRMVQRWDRADFSDVLHQIDAALAAGHP